MSSKVMRITPSIWMSGCVAASIIVVNSMLFVAGIGDCSVVLQKRVGCFSILPKHNPTLEEEVTRILVYLSFIIYYF